MRKILAAAMMLALLTLGATACSELFSGSGAKTTAAPTKAVAQDTPEPTEAPAATEAPEAEASPAA